MRKIAVIVGRDVSTISREIKRNTGGRGYRYKQADAKAIERRANASRGCIPNRVDIDERPAIVEQKIRIGDWEGDTIIGAKHQGAIVSHVERFSKFTLLKKVDNKTSELVIQATIENLSQTPLPFMLTG